MVVIITACTNRKRVPVEAMLRASNLEGGPLEQVAAEWNSRLAVAKPQVEANSLYAGRGFSEARKVAESLGASFLVVSAGLGVVGSNDAVPAYSLTVSARSPESVLAKIQGRPLPQDWWCVGAVRSPFHRGIQAAIVRDDADSELILTSLPSTYIQMIQRDLLALSDNVRGRFRIFTASSLSDLDARLAPLVMPYDARLDGDQSPAPGTLSDFSARALSDFVRHVLPGAERVGADEHRSAVSERLSGWSARNTPARLRQSDEQLLSLIRENWSPSVASASRALRVFRDELGIACEQGRFRTLFLRIQRELDAAQ